jgi:hypothetical protein
LQDLCSNSGELPSSYKLDNVTIDRGDLIGKGGKASVYGGYFNSQKVVVREVAMPRKVWRLPAGQNIIKVLPILFSMAFTDAISFSSYTAR